MFEAFINFGYVLNCVMYLTWGNYLKEPFIYEEINASTLAPRDYLGFSGVWKAQMKALFDVCVMTLMPHPMPTSQVIKLYSGVTRCVLPWSNII